MVCASESALRKDADGPEGTPLRLLTGLERQESRELFLDSTLCNRQFKRDGSQTAAHPLRHALHTALATAPRRWVNQPEARTGLGLSIADIRPAAPERLFLARRSKWVESSQSQHRSSSSRL